MISTHYVFYQHYNTLYINAMCCDNKNGVPKARHF